MAMTTVLCSVYSMSLTQACSFSFGLHYHAHVAKPCASHIYNKHSNQKRINLKKTTLHRS